MKNFDKLFESCKEKIRIDESKYSITDIKTATGKKIYTILNDAKMDIKTQIEKLFKKSDPNRGVISNIVLQEMPDFIELVARLERTSTLKDSFDNDVEVDIEDDFDTVDDDYGNVEDDISDVADTLGVDDEDIDDDNEEQENE